MELFLFRKIFSSLRKYFPGFSCYVYRNPVQEKFSWVGKNRKLPCPGKYLSLQENIFLDFPAMWTDTLFRKKFPVWEKTGNYPDQENISLFRKIFSWIFLLCGRIPCLGKIFLNGKKQENQENFPEFSHFRKKYILFQENIFLIRKNIFPKQEN